MALTRMPGGVRGSGGDPAAYSMVRCQSDEITSKTKKFYIGYFSWITQQSSFSSRKIYLHSHNRPYKLNGNPGNHHEQNTGRNAIVKKFTGSKLL